jgi:hypothetical protein
VVDIESKVTRKLALDHHFQCVWHCCPFCPSSACLGTLVLVAVVLVLNIRETLAPSKVGIGVDRPLSILGNAP